MRLGLDYAGGRPGGAAIRAAGYDFVVRYLSDGGPGLPGKLLTPGEAADLRAHGVSIVANWETWADRMLDGFQAGADDATAALAQARACGMPDNRPIYFSADWDASPEEQMNIDGYLKGAATVLGARNVGIYGGFWPVSRALDNGTAKWAWQTEAWSGGNIEDRRQLHQRLGYANVSGVQCDVNEALADDFGQWDHTVTPAPAAFQYPSTDDMIREIWEQLRGPEAGGWRQLGGLPLVDALAAVGKRFDIPGFNPPQEPK